MPQSTHGYFRVRSRRFRRGRRRKVNQLTRIDSADAAIPRTAFAISMSLSSMEDREGLKSFFVRAGCGFIPPPLEAPFPATTAAQESPRRGGGEKGAGYPVGAAGC